MFYFPAPYPDELFYSACARYHRRGVSGGLKKTATELFDNPDVMAPVDLPSHLNMFISKLPNETGITTERIITDHSLFPYYSPFLDGSRRKELIDMMRGDEKYSATTCIGRSNWDQKRSESLKYCPGCIKQDLQVYGNIFWHRVHQIPEVLFCPYHGDILRSKCPICVEEFTPRRREYLPLKLTCPKGHDLRYVGCEGTELPSSTAMENFISLGKEIVNLMQHSKQFEVMCFDEWTQCYTVRLLEMGLKSHKGIINYRAFYQLFEETFDSMFLTAIYCQVNKSINHDWLKLIVRKHNKAFHPIKHILLIQVLFGSVEQMLKDINMRQDRARIDTFQITSRPISSTKTNSSVVTFKSKKELVLERRSRLLRSMSHLKVPIRSEIKRLNRAIYMWLERNDRDWLEMICPPPFQVRPKRKESVDWVELDNKLSIQIENEVQYLLTASGKPVRITKQILGKRVGQLHLLCSSTRLSKLPLTRDKIHRYVESLDEFHIRKLRWSYLELRKEGKAVRRWELLARSGVREYSQYITCYIEELCS